MKQVPNPYFEACRNPEHPQHGSMRCIDCPDSVLCNRGELIPLTEALGCNGCKYHGIANVNGDAEVCLATGEIILIEDLEDCPLRNEPLQKELSAEEILKYGQMIEEAVGILKQISEELSRLNYGLRREDLEALLYGKTKLRKRDIRAVLDAIDKARVASGKHALKRFIASMGDVRLRDVAIVLDEIEKLNRRYAGDAE